MFRRAALVATFVALSACGGPKANSPVPSEPPGAVFAKLVDEYFDAKFEAKPTSATSVGIHTYDDKVEDLSRACVDKRIATLKAQLARLDAIDRKALSFDEAIDSEALDGAIRGELLELEVIKGWEKNPMGYAGLPGRTIDKLMKRDFAPASQRLASVIARLRAIPPIYAAARANVKNPPKEFTALAIRMAKGSIGFFERDVAAWAKAAAGGATPKEFDEANAKVIAEAKSFAAWLESELAPQSTGKYLIGAKAFLAKMSFDEKVDMPLHELLAKGEAQLAKDYEAFVATAKQIDATKSPAAVMKALSDDHPKEDTLIADVTKSVDDARAFVVSKKLVTLPSEVRPIIAETPPFARNGGFASMDTPGPFEKAAEAFYYVTPVEKDWDAKHKEEHLRLFNPWVTAMINVHEAYPGHYVQFLYSKQFPTKVRKLIHCGTNAEGWAHYTEQMIVDQGFGNGDPKLRLAQLQEALLRDVRYVAGINLHTKGWSVEDAAKLFETKAFQEPANAYEEARRGTYNPTYLYYTLGKLQIQELAAEYRSKTGATLTQFHDAFVAQGALPIAFVRRILLATKPT